MVYFMIEFDYDADTDTVCAMSTWVCCSSIFVCSILESSSCSGSMKIEPRFVVIMKEFCSQVIGDGCGVIENFLLFDAFVYWSNWPRGFVCWLSSDFLFDFSLYNSWCSSNVSRIVSVGWSLPSVPWIVSSSGAFMNKACLFTANWTEVLATLPNFFSFMTSDIRSWLF